MYRTSGTSMEASTLALPRNLWPTNSRMLGRSASYIKLMRSIARGSVGQLSHDPMAVVLVGLVPVGEACFPIIRPALAKCPETSVDLHHRSPKTQQFYYCTVFMSDMIACPTHRFTASFTKAHAVHDSSIVSSVNRTNPVYHY